MLTVQVTVAVPLLPLTDAVDEHAPDQVTLPVGVMFPEPATVAVNVMLDGCPWLRTPLTETLGVALTTVRVNCSALLLPAVFVAMMQRV